MGIRFRKSVNIAPGVRLNFGKKSTGISFGSKGGRVSINSNGKVTTSAGIPGSGLYYTKSQTIGSTARHKSNSKSEVIPGMDWDESVEPTSLLMDEKHIKALSDRDFSRYVSGYLKYADQLKPDQEVEIAEARAQVQMINTEIDRRKTQLQVADELDSAIKNFLERKRWLHFFLSIPFMILMIVGAASHWGLMTYLFGFVFALFLALFIIGMFIIS